MFGSEGPRPASNDESPLFLKSSSRARDNSWHPGLSQRVNESNSSRTSSRLQRFKMTSCLVTKHQTSMLPRGTRMPLKATPKRFDASALELNVAKALIVAPGGNHSG